MITYLRTAVLVLAAGIFFLLFQVPGRTQENSNAAVLQGTVRDLRHTTVASATVTLRAEDGPTTLTAHTDSNGIYRFSGVRNGIYTLRAEAIGGSEAVIAHLTLASKDIKTFDLTLGAPSSVQPSTLGAPEFSNEAQFTVAGVTDPTNLGGHGSDTVVRTRETIAKETVTLGKDGPADNAASVATEKSLRDSLQRNPQSFEANYRLGKALVEDGKPREAIQYLDSAARLNPDNYENTFELLVANANSGSYENARVGAQILLVRYDRPELHHLLGGVQEKLGDSLAAVREYQRAAELSPTEPNLFDWGSELLMHHAPEPALEVFKKGSRLFPHSVRMMVGQGAAWYGRGSDKEAVERICAASDLNPSDMTPYLFLGMIDTAESKPSDDVAERLGRFAKLKPENAQANYYYAVSLWKRRKSPEDSGDRLQVESLLNKAVLLDPQLATAYLQLGIVYTEAKDYSKAISAYQQAIQADPKLETAHYRLGQVYRQTGEIEKSRAELRLYDQLSKESEQRIERERHEIRQFVYTLRDQPPPPHP